MVPTSAAVCCFSHSHQSNHWGGNWVKNGFLNLPLKGVNAQVIVTHTHTQPHTAQLSLSAHCLWRKRACDTREQSVTCWLPWILLLLDHHHHHYHRHHHHHQYRHYHHCHHHHPRLGHQCQLLTEKVPAHFLPCECWCGPREFAVKNVISKKAAIRNVIDFLATSKGRKKVFQSVISKDTIWDVIDLSQSQKEERNHLKACDPK